MINKYYIIMNTETLELSVIHSELQPVNSVLVTEENSKFIKPKANDIVFTEVVEGITDDEIKVINEERNKELKELQYNELQPTDWYFTRFIELGVEVPKEIIEERKQIRKKYETLKTK